MIESDPSTLLDRTGGETINLLRYSKIDNNALDKKFKFLADFVEKAKLKKRIRESDESDESVQFSKDAKFPSKKVRYGYEEMGDSSSEAESDDSND